MEYWGKDYPTLPPHLPNSFTSPSPQLLYLPKLRCLPWVGVLDAEFVEHLDELLVERLVGADAFGEGHVDDLVVTHADHDVALSLLDGLDGPDTRPGGEYAVVGRGSAATLQMAENGDAHVEAGELLLHAVGIIECASLGTL